MNEDINDFEFGDIIGEGSTGKVKLAISKNTNKKYAIKIIKKKFIANQPVVVSKVNREIAIMQCLKHPNLLRLHFVLQSREDIFLVEQYAAYGCLFDKVMQLSPIEAISYFRQIIYGLEYLHSKGFCHRDLKPENILLNDPESLVIADFGLACWMPNNVASTYCGSPHYTAPEITYGNQYDGRKADIWSAGCILYAMLVKALPFQDKSIRKLIIDIRSGNYIIPPDIPQQGADLIRRLLNIDPMQRIDIDQIKEHQFFRIGLPDGYILPKPMPMLCRNESYCLSSENIETLKTIGFEEEEINSLSKEGPSRAKAFAEFLTQDELGLLLWDNAQLPDHPLANPCDDLMDSSEPCLAEQQKTIVGIHLKRPDLVFQLQRYLTSCGYEWLHLDGTRLIARSEDLLLILKTEWENNGRVLKIKGTGFTKSSFLALYEYLTQMFIPYISLADNSQMSDEMNRITSEEASSQLEGGMYDFY